MKQKVGFGDRVGDRMIWPRIYFEVKFVVRKNVDISPIIPNPHVIFQVCSLALVTH